MRSGYLFIVVILSPFVYCRYPTNGRYEDAELIDTQFIYCFDGAVVVVILLAISTVHMHMTVVFHRFTSGLPSTGHHGFDVANTTAI